MGKWHNGTFNLITSKKLKLFHEASIKNVTPSFNTLIYKTLIKRQTFMTDALYDN